MARIDDATKKDRLDRIYLILSRNQRGLTEAEIADEVNLERRTANNYLRELEEQGKAFKDGIYWFPLILRESRLRSFDLSPEEAVTLYLGARLLVKQQDKRNEPAETALLKLASVLKADAGVGDEIEQAARELALRPVQENYQPIFREIVRGYIYRKKVEITYHPLSFTKPFQTVFSTYLLEPSPIGFSTYLIGHSSIVNAQRAYKLERIESAHMVKDDYSIPPDFAGLEILRNAWSIIAGDETTRVLLRFNSKVKPRVLETRWHPSQQTREDPEKPGSLLWEVQVTDTLDLLPWVRGWGADVEVIEPKALRDSLIREAQGLAELYKVMEVKKQLFAHFREKDKDHKEPQYLWAHLTEASELAKNFANKIGLSKSGEILGLLHDLGKASEAFQNYLLSGEGILNPDSDHNYVDHVAMKGKIDHSTAGAQIIYNRLWSKGSEGRIVAQVLSLAIASHHSGLIDCLSPSGEDNFTRRMEKAEASSHVNEAFSNLAEYERTAIEELLADDLLIREVLEKLKSVKEENESQQTLWFKYGLLIRYLFSCLLDADRLNTADFEFPGNARLRNNNIYSTWESLIERLNVKMDEFEKKPNRNEVDEIRSRVSQSCLEFSLKPKGIYQLTVPTGGGKTFASLRFALNHAKEHSMDRVFYVIPYTSIIDQNADEARKVLEDKDKNGNYLNKVVLEHHSNLTPDEETRRQNLLAENWDAPIVFTTQVQFLEALFGSGTRGARRMHQLANSVIIFDDIQTIPIRTVHMFNLAIRFLVQSCGATVVLCTATQPLLDKVEPIQRALNIKPEQKIIPYEKELFQQLKRVEVFDRRKVGGWSDKETAELAVQELREKGSVLIVANTKKSAYSLYQAIAEMGIPCIHLYHLSTNMCPAHRLNLLNKIKGKLKSKMAKPVICVSTQLIEAGVDIDFGAVIRHLAGMDSIAQAAGRCNRNGIRKGGGNVWVVNPAEENLDRLKDIKVGREKAQTILDDFNDNPDSFGNDRIGLNAMESYYKHYFYERQGEMNYPVNADSPIGRADDLFTLLSTNESSMEERQRVTKDATVLTFRQSFQTAAKAFRVIDSLTQGVIVPYGKEGNEIITELCGVDEVEKRYKLIKKAQRFSVNLFPHEFRKLADSNAIREVQKGAGIFYLDKQYYSEKFGWSDNPVNGMEDLIV
ncbi:MAG: CRISPR-associated helicase Cas3' [Chloroflexi bacterium]|nr:CRISPR-associated helicase Cas3' [Chloroflexota bacterium]